MRSEFYQHMYHFYGQSLVIYGKFRPGVPCVGVFIITSFGFGTYAHITGYPMFSYIFYASGFIGACFVLDKSRDLWIKLQIAVWITVQITVWITVQITVQITVGITVQITVQITVRIANQYCTMRVLPAMEQCHNLWHVWGLFPRLSRYSGIVLSIVLYRVLLGYHSFW